MIKCHPSIDRKADAIPTIGMYLETYKKDGRCMDKTKNETTGLVTCVYTSVD